MPDRLPSELVSGFEEMDAEHAAIMRALRSLEETARQGDLAATRAAFSSLSDALVANFQAEERWMATVAFPERARHQAAHELFLQDLAQVAAPLAEGRSAPLLDWLSSRAPEWITFHIRVNDIPLGRYLDARAARGPGPGRASKPEAP